MQRGIRGSRSRVSSAAPPWGPSLLSGLEAWYRETYAAGTWSDLSGNGRHLTQDDADLRPTQVARWGQPVLDFANDWVQGTLGASVGHPNTVYVVWEAKTGAGSATRDLLNGDAVNQRRLYLNTASDAPASAVCGFGSSFQTQNAGAGAVSVGQVYATAAVFDGASSALYAASDFVTPAVSGSLGSVSLTGLTVGARYDGSGTFLGYIGEMILFSGAHDAATRKLVGDYLTARYAGLTVTT